MKTTLCKFIEKINTASGFQGEVRYDEPMAAHTTFRAGGPADCWVRPRREGFPEYASALLGAARSGGVPVFILGAGANIVVADRGIRGVVLDTGGWTGFFPGGLGERERTCGSMEPPNVFFLAGTPVDAALEAAAEAGLSGLEFLAGMPGSIGGAVWMNARCYGRSIADCLTAAEILDETGNRIAVPCAPEDFSYKKSPFQERDVLILGARFVLSGGRTEAIRGEMAAHRQDREAKGHYRFPSAGSVFKNNRAWGKPTGRIIDELGLRGLSLGGAAVAEWHGNIIINRGNACAGDIRALTDTVAARVRAALGITLEPEIRFVGEW
ncbi:MAG: UDP-N-acetylmuramate dehydrogenase [Treponema sp.]|jgi:UDP-N-acetylmuramate dehydrogenase|nr:UDP-N-acetylmuramate dehydrogenase [Treponema sp.]